MNSEGLTVAIAPRVRAPRSILTLMAVWIALLTALGLACVNKGDEGWFPAAAIALLPAIVYLLGCIRYGGALFANAAPAEKATEWWRLVQIAAVIYAGLVAMALTVAIHAAFSGERPTGAEVTVGLTGTALVLGLLAMWTYVARQFILKAGASPGAWARAALVTGSAMMLASVALPVNYETQGWQVLAWQGGLPINWFIQIKAASPFLNALWFAGYLLSLVLAALSLWTGVRLLANKPLGRQSVSRLGNLGIAVFWFAVTSYACECSLLSVVGINFFGLDHIPEFLLITGAWLAMLAGGLVWWFRYRLRTDSGGRQARTALLLWALPFTPLTLVLLTEAAGFQLYGLILFQLGALIVPACWWWIGMSQLASDGNFAAESI